MTTIRVERPVDATAEAAWAVIGRPETIHEYAGNISRAETEGTGEGMHRRCWDNGGDYWDETCRAWVPGERYTFEVHTESSGSRIHKLFRRFLGSFGVTARDDGTAIWASFELEPKGGPLGWLVMAAMRPLFKHGIAQLLDGWAEAIEAERPRTAPA